MSPVLTVRQPVAHAESYVRAPHSGTLVAARGRALLRARRERTAERHALVGRMHRLADNHTDVDVPGTQRRDEIGEMARAVVVFRNNAIELMLSQQGLAQQASMQ